MGRSPSRISKEGLNKGAWTVLEDQMLTDYVKNHGEGRWGKIPKQTGLKRCGKSCRLRWLNYLRPDITRGNISQDEEDLIIRLHRLLGNRWSLIAGRLPGRTDNEIKNYWNTTLSKKVQGMYSKQSKIEDPIKEPSSEIITSPKIESHFSKTKPEGRHNDSTVALPTLLNEYRLVEMEPSMNEALEKNKEGQSDYSDELLTNDTPWESMMDLKDGQISLSEVFQAEFVKLPLNNLMMVEDHDNGYKTWSFNSSLDEYHLFFEEFR